MRCLQDPCEGLGCNAKAIYPIEEERELELEEEYVDKLRLQREKIESLKQEFLLKEEDLAQKNFEIQKLNARLDCLEDYRLSYEQLLPKYERLAFEYKKLTQQRRKAEEELQRHRGQNLGQLLSRAKEATAQSENQKGVLLLKVAKLQNDLARCRECMQESDTKHSALQHSIKIKVQALKAQLERLSLENAALQEEKERVMDQESYRAKEGEELSCLVMRLKGQLQTAREIIAKKDCEICAGRNQLDQYKLHHHKEMSVKTMSIDKLAADFKRANTMLAEMRLRNEELDSRNHDISCALQRTAQESQRLQLQNKQSNDQTAEGGSAEQPKRGVRNGGRSEDAAGAADSAGRAAATSVRGPD